MIYEKGKLKMTRTARRFLSGFLALLMVVGLIPTNALAAPADDPTVTIQADVNGSLKELNGASISYDTSDDYVFTITAPDTASGGEAWAGWDENTVAIVRWTDNHVESAYAVRTDDTNKTAIFRLNTHNVNGLSTSCTITVASADYRSVFTVKATGQPDANVTYGDTYVLPVTQSTATPEGRVFIGWKEADGTIYAPGANVTVKKNLNFTEYFADVNAEQYIVTFQDGTGNVLQSAAYDNGAAVTAPADPSREGYTFAGWDNGWAAGTTATANVVYTAQWTAKEYDISLDSSTASNVDIVSSTIPDRANTGDTVVVSLKAKAGYEVTGVILGGDGIGYVPCNLIEASGEWYRFSFTMPAANVKILAVVHTQDNEVTFMTDGEGVWDTQNVETGDYAAEPAEPTKEGYTFEGWSTEKGNAGKIVDVTTTAITEATTYYAIFTQNTYSITTDSLVTSDKATAIIGETVTLTVDVMPEGQKFAGITVVGDDGASILPTDAGIGTYTFVMPAQNVTVSVQSAPKQYNVKYMVDGSLYDIQRYDYGTPVAPPAVPAKEGYENGRWVNVETGTTCQPGVHTITQDVTYAAQYTAEKYEVTTEVVGADVAEIVLEGTAPDTYAVDSTVKMSITTPTGYVLTGIIAANADDAEQVVQVMTIKDGEKYSFTMPAFNVKVTATFEKIPAECYVIKFVADGSLYDVAYAAEGEVIPAPADPSKTGYTFDGWYDGADKLNSNTKASKDVTYTAEFEAEDYNIVTVVDPASGAAVDTNTGKYGEVKTITVTPETGYEVESVTVIGFSGNAVSCVPVTGTVYQFTMPAEDVTVTVTFKEVPAGKAIVKFVSNGALYDLQVVTKGENGTTPAVAPAREGYGFLGWSNDGGATKVNSGTAYTVAADAADEVVYEAQWEENNKEFAIITTTPEGVTLTCPDNKALVGAQVKFTAEEAEGYDLAYVTVTTDGGVAVEAIRTGSNEYAFTMPGDNVTISAKALKKVQVYTIDFKLADGTMYDRQTLEEGAAVTVPAAPVKEGYNFIGWFDAKSGGNQIVEPATAEGNATWYARFEAKTLTVDYVDVKDAAAPTGITVTYGAPYTVITPADTTKFVCWAASDGQIMLPGQAYTFTQDVTTLTAVYETVDPIYIVTFKDLDGKVYYSALAQLDNDYTVTAPSFPAAEGYDMSNAKWVNGSASLDAGAVITGINSDAVYTIDDAEQIDYTINKVVNGVDEVYVQVANKANYGDVVIVTAAEVPGYLLTGITVETAAEAIPVSAKADGTYTFTMPAADVTVTAVYEEIPPETYVVKFMANGSMYDWAFVAKDDIITPPAENPVKTGATFKQWNTVENGSGNKLNTDSTATSDITYYAVFENTDYNIYVTENPDLSGAAVAGPTAIYGEIKTLTIADKTAEGYVLDSITIVDANGNAVPYAPVAAGSVYSFMMPASDVTVTVNYAEIPAGSSVVKFVSDGALYDYQVVTQGTQGRTPAAAPTKDGYTFTGWSKDGVISVAANALYDVLEGDPEIIVYTAQWVQNPTDFVISTVETNTSITAPTIGTVGENVTFTVVADAGFDLSYVRVYKTATGEVVTGVTNTGVDTYTFVMPEADVTIEAAAVDHVDIYTIDFKLDDGTMYDQQTLAEGTPITIPAAPSKEGHTFLGWFDAQTGGNSIGDTPVADGDATWYAHFEANDLTVNYVDEKDQSAPTGITVKYGEPYTVLAPADNTKFICWAADDGQIMLPGKAYTFTQDVTTLTAIYETVDPIYVVEFKGIDGKVYHTALAQLDNNYTVVTPYAPALEGYTVKAQAWQKTDGTVSYAAGVAIDNIAENMEFVLDAEANTYPITINVAPSEVGAENVSATNGIYGETVVVTANIPAGYYLKDINAVTASGKGIALAPTETEGIYTFVMPAEAVTINVTYEEIPAGYSLVKFISEDSLFDYQVVERGTTATAPTAPVRNGYTFKGWSRDNGVTTVAANGVYQVALGDDDVIEYIAQWDAVEYNVVYDAAGGTPTPSSEINITYGSQITLPAGPTLAGSTFVGWQDALTGMVYDAGVKYTVTASTTFTAIYTVNEYVVKFVDPVTGILYGYEGVAAGTAVTAPVAPVRIGYNFVEWAEEGNDTNRVAAGGTTAAITKDTTFVAVWEAAEYTVTAGGTNCTVNPSTQRVTYAEDVTFTVTPDADYEIETVYITYTEGGIPVITVLNPITENADGSKEYGFVMPGADVEITAVAKQTVFNVFDRTDANVNIGPHVDKAKVDDDVVFTVSADKNYSVGNVFVETTAGTKIPVSVVLNGNDVEYHFTMPASDVTINVQEVQNEHTVYYLDADNTLLETVTVKAGETTTAKTLTAPEGYNFIGWKWLMTNKADIAPGADFTVEEDMYLQAIYEGKEYEVSAGVTENIYILKADQGKDMSNSVDILNNRANTLVAKTGTTVYFQVAADYNWMISEITITSKGGNTDLAVAPTLIAKSVVTGAPTGQEDQNGSDLFTYAFTMPAESVEINVYTKAREYNVQVVENVPENGDYTINGYRTTNHNVAQGSTVEIAVVPEAGYIVKSVVGTYTNKLGLVTEVAGTFDSAAGTYTFPMVPFDVTVVIEYEAIPYNVNVTNSNGTAAAPGTYNPQIDGKFGKALETFDVDNKGYIVLLNADDSLKVEQDFATGITYPVNGEYNVGDTVRFQIATYRGWVFNGVSVTYAGGTKTVPVTLKDGVYYFTMPAEDDVVITADFVKDYYTITKEVVGEDHGSILMNGLTENRISAEYKSDVNVVVTPDEGYYVKSISYALADTTANDFSNGVRYDGTLLTDVDDTAHEITFHVPSSDVTVSVEYAKIDYTLTTKVNGIDGGQVNDQEGGKIELSTVKTTVGEQVEITSTPHHGYRMVSLVVTNKTTGEVVLHSLKNTEPEKDVSNYYFTMPADPVEVSAVFEKVKFVVTYINYDNTVVGYEAITYQETADVAGHVQNVVAGANGKHFIGWVSDDVETPVTVPSVNNDDFVVVKDTIIKAVFDNDVTNVVFNATVNGVVESENNATPDSFTLVKKYKDKITFTATPDAGYEVDKVTVTTLDKEGEPLYVNFTESFEGKVGTYSFSIPATYKDSVHDVQSEDVVVTVTFRTSTYTLTEADDNGTNGTVAVNGRVSTQKTFNYQYQESVTITATPDAGYYVVSIVVTADDDGDEMFTTGVQAAPAMNTPAGDPLTLSFAMPDEDVTYKVTYAKIDYSITRVFNEEQGTVTSVDNAQIDDVVDVTVEPKQGYKLESLTATYDNGRKSLVLTEVGENQFTFTMPAKAVTITAVFTEVTYTATLTKEGEGTVRLNGHNTTKVNADYLDVVVIDATPKAGWELTSITVDGGNVDVTPAIDPDGGTYEFVMPNYDVEISVVFERYESAVDVYEVNAYEDGHGLVTIAETGKVGDKMTLVADPHDGYRVKRVIVTDAEGNSIPVSFVSETKEYVETWSFTMPASAVSVKVVFEAYAASYYVDCRTDDWYYDAVTYVTDQGYFTGMTDNIFGPNILMTREMFVAVLARMEGVDISKYYRQETGFVDVDIDGWYTPYIAWALEAGVTTGYTDGSNRFGVNDPITREQMFTMMYRYAKLKGVDTRVTYPQFMDRYIDKDEISEYAYEALVWCVSEGVAKGMSDNTINPQEYAPRAHAAQMFKNYCDNVWFR